MSLPEAAKMLTIVCKAPGELLAEHRPVPVRAPDEVLIRVRRVGVCGTDMHILGGTQPYLSYPRVFGHEVAGEVVDAPAGSALTKGTIVYVMPYLSCGICIACKHGRTNCCTRMQVLGVHRDGAMTEFITVHESFVFNAFGISLDDAAMVEFLAIGAHAVRRAALKKESRILVVGAGPIGMAVAWFARTAGAEVTVLDQRESRLAFCESALHADHVVLAAEGQDTQLKVLTNGDFFDCVFDATGSASAMRKGLDYVAHGGTYVLVSIVQADISFSDPEFHKRETTLLASRNATIEDFETVLAELRENRIPVAQFRTHRATLDTLIEVMPTWLHPDAGVIKAVVEC